MTVTQENPAPTTENGTEEKTGFSAAEYFRRTQDVLKATTGEAIKIKDVWQDLWNDLQVEIKARAEALRERLPFSKKASEQASPEAVTDAPADEA